MSGRRGSSVGTRYHFPFAARLRSSRWGPRFSSSAPPRSPAPPFDHFPFGPAILRRRLQSGTCAWVGQNFPLGIGRGSGGERVEVGGDVGGVQREGLERGCCRIPRTE